MEGKILNDTVPVVTEEELKQKIEQAIEKYKSEIDKNILIVNSIGGVLLVSDNNGKNYKKLCDVLDCKTAINFDDYEGARKLKEWADKFAIDQEIEKLERFSYELRKESKFNRKERRHSNNEKWDETRWKRRKDKFF